MLAFMSLKISFDSIMVLPLGSAASTVVSSAEAREVGFFGGTGGFFARPVALATVTRGEDEAEVFGAAA